MLLERQQWAAAAAFIAAFNLYCLWHPVAPPGGPTALEQQQAALLAAVQDALVALPDAEAAAFLLLAELAAVAPRLQACQVRLRPAPRCARWALPACAGGGGPPGSPAFMLLTSRPLARPPTCTHTPTQVSIVHHIVGAQQRPALAAFLGAFLEVFRAMPLPG